MLDERRMLSMHSDPAEAPPTKSGASLQRPRMPAEGFRTPEIP
jgi:hypothetical protein